MREMKDSGIDYIGQIPLNWKECRLKFLCLITTGNEDTQNSDPDGEFPFYVRSPIIEKSKKYTFDGEGILVAGDGAGAGRIFHHAYGKYAVHQRVYRLYNFGFNSNFICYYLSNLFPFEMDKGSAQSTVPSMRLPMLSNFTLFLPELTIASKIADFLDQKCSEIDALTADIQTQIETLEEYKKSVITEAVTKGLDPNVEMKDSHCFYVGLINKNWDTTKIGYFCKKMYHPVDENLIPLICSNKGKVEIRDNSLVGRMVSENHAMQGIRQGEIAIHGMDTWHGAIGISTFDGNITRVVHVCQSTGDNRFVVYYLQSLAFRNVYKLISNGIRGNTSDFRSWELVKKIVAPHPSKTEQSQIADFLDQKCSEIDQTISEKQQQLETLAEYKKSLIYEYVTGKMEVD